jgi:hypothetical protein
MAKRIPQDISPSTIIYIPGWRSSESILIMETEKKSKKPKSASKQPDLEPEEVDRVPNDSVAANNVDKK